MNEFNLTSELIASLSGVVISLLFSYFPALRVKFAALTAEVKSGIMLALMAGVVAVITGLNYAGILDAGLTFDKAGIVRIVWTFLLAVISNQATYQISPQQPDVKEAKGKGAPAVMESGEWPGYTG